MSERFFTWYWSTFKRPMLVSFGDEKVIRLWGGIYGLKCGDWFFGATRAWSPSQQRTMESALARLREASDPSRRAKEVEAA